MNSRIVVALVLFVAVALVSVLPVSAELKNAKEGYWEIQVAYPRVSSSGPVPNSFNASSKAKETKDYNFFLRRAQGEVPVLKRQSNPDVQYGLTVVPTTSLDTPAICSGYAERYVFTGGAHGMTTFYVQNLALIKGQSRVLKLQDLFKKGVNGRSATSKALLARLKKMDPVPGWVDTGEWKALSAEQAEQFNVTPAGLLFLFSPYELGPYAEGTQKVLLPYSSISGLDTNGILKSIVATSRTPIGMLTTGRWSLKSIEYNDGKVLRSTDLDTNWIEFRSSTVMGKAGINSFRGTYKATADGTLTVGRLAMTRAANPEGSIAADFEKQIGKVSRFMVKDGRLILEMPYDSGIMIFEWPR